MTDVYPNSLPLEGPFRLPLLFLEASIVYIILQVAMLFLKHYYSNKDTIKGSKLQLAWFWMSVGYAGTMFMYLFSDFFTVDPIRRDLLLNIAYLSEATGALFFFFNIEKLEVIKTKRFFTFLFGIMYFVMLGMIIFNQMGFDLQDIVSYFTYAFLVPMIALFLLYNFMIFKLLPRKLKVRAVFTFIPTFFLSFGAMMSGDAFIEDYGPISRFIGDLMQVVGEVSLSIYFLKIPTYRELEWKRNLNSIIVIAKGGINVFKHDFKKDRAREELHPALVSSAIDVIRSLLSELITGELKVLDNEDTKILIERGELVTVAMIADDNLESLNFLLHQFRVEFEAFFWKTLQDWDGDSDSFKSAEIVLERVFL